MKKSRGFTLVELLAVIVILAVILVIAIPNIMKIIDKARLDTYKRTEGMLVSATRSYLAGNNITFTDNVPVAVNYNTLRDNNYIAKIYDQVDKSECINSKIYITKVGNTYTYKPGLVCTNYISLDTFNLVINNGFEDGLNNWYQNTNYGGALFTIDSSDKINGLNSIRADATSYSKTLLNSQSQLISEHKYLISMNINSDTGIIFGYTTSISSGALSGQQLVSVNTLNNWQRKSYIYNVPIVAAPIYFGLIKNISGTYAKLDNIDIIDLTDIYGAGNEPSDPKIIDTLINKSR
jgi:type IV pilus assembly protein PilA